MIFNCRSSQGGFFWERVDDFLDIWLLFSLLLLLGLYDCRGKMMLLSPKSMTWNNEQVAISDETCIPVGTYM